MDTLDDEQKVSAAVRAQFIGIAPERQEELDRLWSDYDLTFHLLDDKAGPVMEAGLYKYVRFNHRTLRVIWVSAFAAWEAYRCIALAELSGGPLQVDHLRTLLELALSVRDAPDPYAVFLHNLPEPGEFPDRDEEKEMRACAELAVWASGWAILHEIRHIQHQREGTSVDEDAAPECRHAEEFSCDAFATRFLLERLGEYSQTSGDSADDVYLKRSLGIYVAMVGLMVLAHDKWNASPSHPSLQERFDAVRRLLGQGADGRPHAIATCMTRALRAVWPTAPSLV